MSVAAAGKSTEFSVRVRDFVERLDCRLARTLDEREAIFRLRYDAYVREGTIEPNKSKLFKDRYDDLPNAYNFGCYFDGVMVSSLRLHVGSPRHPVTPSVSVFSDILGPEIDTGKVLIDPTRFVADPLLAREYPYLPQATVRLPFLACEHFNADIGLAACREEHRAFYKRMFFLHQDGEPRPYPPLTKPIALLRFDYRETREKVIARHPFMASTAAERERLFGAAPKRVVPTLIRSSRPMIPPSARASSRPFSIHAA
ncbi:N-acyl amino acid synthase FeeM domain-containing protein [Terrarubrum flagellatum]|uniref:N-acyl amino acid synthase FeeM domain-containing protein n=1 Tax=Terrirubrum flagellatum TaxID=2895980 RepID=UPI003145515D